jgi:protein-disulfide isomerase
MRGNFPERRRPLRLLSFIALAALALTACQKTGAADDAAFGQKVRTYLLAHPEVLQETAAKLQAKQDADEAAARRAGLTRLPSLRAALERDPHDYVANPGGQVTVTEFYDYRCPHCVSIAPSIVALARGEPDVRVVFKEMPIFGAVSERAARAALAVKAAGGDYLGLYQAYMAAPNLDRATIDRLALARGARMSDIEGPAAAGAQAQLARNDKLFNQIGLSGTPAFVVGDQIISGEDLPALQQAIVQARHKAAGRT